MEVSSQQKDGKLREADDAYVSHKFLFKENTNQRTVLGKFWTF